MPNYQNSKIYKLWSPEGDDIYIGSTTQPLYKRKNSHKKKECSSRILFEKYNDVRIELLESVPCNNKEELIKKEGEYIRNNICVNRRIAGRTRKEYREDNKEIIKEKKRLEYLKQKELRSLKPIIACGVISPHYDAKVGASLETDLTSVTAVSS